MSHTATQTINKQQKAPYCNYRLQLIPIHSQKAFSLIPGDPKPTYLIKSNFK